MIEHYYIGIDPGDSYSYSAICIMKNKEVISCYKTDSTWNKLRFQFDIWKYKNFYDSTFLVENSSTLEEKELTVDELIKSSEELLKYENAIDKGLLQEMIDFSKNYKNDIRNKLFSKM